MNKNALQFIRPSLIVFAAATAFFITGKTFLEKNGFSQHVLIFGNLVLFGASLVAFYIYYTALKANKPQAFVRAMYGSFMARFFIVAIAAFIYISIAKKDVNKPALIACAVLYILYSFIEIRALTKLLKGKKNA